MYLNDIYDEIYQKDLSDIFHIFLCGAKTTEKNSLRNKINQELEQDPRIEISFPEDIFNPILNKHNMNLLDLEKELALYVDLIVLPLEGVGAIAELGCFASFKDLEGKIFIINKEEYSKGKNKNSFINLGPINLISKKYPNNVFYYNEENEGEIIKKVISRIKSKRKTKKNKKDLFSNYLKLNNFIFYIIALKQPICYKELRKTLIENNQIKKHHIDVAIEILFKKKLIYGNKESYNVNENGYSVLNEKLKKIYKLKFFSDLRFNELNNKRLKNKVRKFNIISPRN